MMKNKGHSFEGSIYTNSLNKIHKKHKGHSPNLKNNSNNLKKKTTLFNIETA